jgi:hypothetical protein
MIQGRVEEEKYMPGFRNEKWLLFFYSIPSKPVNARMKIWRRLAKAGAVQFKGAVYILPYNEENLELCQWLVSEVTEMKGEGAFVKAERVETMKDSEIIELFNTQREKDYGKITYGLDEFERKISSIRKGGGMHDSKKFMEKFNRHLRDFEDITKIDFFTSKTGTALKKKIRTLQGQAKGLLKPDIKPILTIIPRNIRDYQNKIWATREKPFVDRMASAWLIKKFIDKKAAFTFIDEKDIETPDKNTIAFDVRGGEFTHAGDLCTFEVLMKTFGLKDKTLKKISEIVHELDIKDEKYKTPEAKGTEDILRGIRTTAKTDTEILEKGMNVFEMLYASRK